MGCERIWISWFGNDPWNPMVFVDFMDYMVWFGWIWFSWKWIGLVWIWKFAPSPKSSQKAEAQGFNFHKRLRLEAQNSKPSMSLLSLPCPPPMRVGNFILPMLSRPTIVALSLSNRQCRCFELGRESRGLRLRAPASLEGSGLEACIFLEGWGSWLELLWRAEAQGL